METTGPDATVADRYGPGVRLPPPLVFLAFLLAGAGLHYLAPVGIADSALLRFIGASLCLLAVLTLFLLGLTFRRRKTPMEPWKPTASIISHGFYAYSRNPIYVAFCFIVIGIGLSRNSLWMVLSFLPSAFVVFHTAIRREEQYLEQKFGAGYRRYRERVRRWF